MTATENKGLGADPIERNWMRFSVVLLVAFAATVTVAGFFMGFTVPGADQEVDPQTVTQEGPFSEPGLREVAEGKYDAYIVAQTFSYTPGLLEIPVGAEVTFYVTSIDVQHGFNIRDTNINMQIVPGQVSKLTHTFEEPGEFPFICTEYCGSQHHAMFGTIRVVSGTGAEG
ncbi:MAG: cytochrome c oxidase subunit II [Acidimicrobiales bacterium]|nr:cytochrome c oxidase subunit II [Acidimicrobiales bacterium]